MKLTNKIAQTLREATVSSTMGDDNTTTVVASANNLTKTLKDVESSRKQGGGDVEVEVMDENIGDDLESVDRGADMGEEGEEAHEEEEDLKNQVAMDEVVAKMSKGDLEKLIETKIRPKKRIIKVGDLKRK